ncbi:V-set domain-containing T-cell activation inhibitor 1-like isoform X2 [Heterodontus francisci]|uniref:V-set domain-containing T-cell activation inhibitor 1-like isoform X2 n=1 Tax=Heterodontus francisci TaxID=7792 RepID=UPI00355B8F18
MMLDDFRVFGKALQLSVTISTENAAEQENGIIHSPDKTAGGYIGGHNISARVGGDVLLPCKSDPNGIAKGSIYWQKVKPNIVAWYWNKGKEDSQYQDPQYRNRTLIANSEVIRGNLSLLIQGLQLNDSGEYECIVSKKGSMTAERLIVRLAVNNSKMETEVNTKPDSFDNYTKPNNTDGEHHVRHHYGVIGSFIFFTIAFVLFLVLWKISKSSAME